MTILVCCYCNGRIPQDQYNNHMREKHATPTVQDMCRAKENYQLLYAMLHQRRAMTASAPPQPPSIPSSSEATLHGSGDGSGKMSTTFSEWQAQNKFALTQSTECITADDVSSFRVDRSDAPQTTARSLQKSTKYDIQEFVNEFQELGSEDREKCNDLIRKMPVFACLSAYIFTHLKLCVTDQRSLLDSFLLVTQEWINKPEEWCLLNYQAIKTDLSTFLKRSQVAHHNCNQQLLDSARLHYLDIHSLAALVIIYSTDPSHIQSFYSMRDNQAQAMLDLLQELIDLRSDRLDGWYKRRFLDAVVRLSRKSRLYPQSLNITGVEQAASTGDRGGFGAIFRGVLSGRVVALKELQTAGRSADDYLKDFCQEAVVWRNVHHKNCLPFYGVTNFVYDGVSRTCMVSPWMTNGNLHVYLSRNPDVPRLPLLLDIASGLEYLHVMQPTVVHGDLKSLNIFVTASGRACLADFGLATVHDTQVSVATTIHGIYGTAGYMAPELISVWEDPNGVTLLARLDRRRCDVFAFGCIAFEVYTGGPPFQGNDPTMRSQMLLSGGRPRRPTDARALKLGLDDDMWMFIGSLWAHRPEARLVAASARDFLRYKLSATGQGTSRPVDDPEWDTGFLNSLVVANDIFSLL
ncbi:kinase-like protein [Imleria badia]|nr:kinase-like protein [Imleria badia]